MEQDEKTTPIRNQSLDVLRTLALMLMVSIHLVRGFLGDLPGTWEIGARFIMESAPAFFFVAVGMTILHTANTPKKWQRVFELGIISFLHQGYTSAIYPFHFDFFMLLWLMLFLATLLRPLFNSRWFRILLLPGIFLANLYIPLEKFGVWSAGPFGPIPWALLVIAGMSVGLKSQPKTLRRNLESVGVLLILIAILIRLYGGGTSRLIASSVAFTKWHPTSSTYILLWAGIIIMIYGLINMFEIKRNSPVGRFTGVVSSNLLAGTVIHYLVVSLFTKLLEQSGYNATATLPWFMLIIIIVIACFADYVAILIMINVRKLLTNFVISGKDLYKLGWIISIVMSLAVLYLSLESIMPSAQIAIAHIGMIIASFAFMRLQE